MTQEGSDIELAQINIKTGPPSRRPAVALTIHKRSIVTILKQVTVSELLPNCLAENLKTL